MAEKSEDEVVSLELSKARKFLHRLAEDPFICVVMVDDEIRIYSKGIEEGHVDRIRDFLREIEGEG